MYISIASKWFRAAVQIAVRNWYQNARSVFIFKARKLLLNLSKHVLPILATSNVICKFVYCCDISYVWLNTKRVGNRIRQYVLNYAMELFDKRVLPMQKQVLRFTYQKALASWSFAILKYLLENDNCAGRYWLIHHDWR